MTTNEAPEDLKQVVAEAGAEAIKEPFAQMATIIGDLATEMDRRFAEVHADIKELNTKHDTVLTIVDGIASSLQGDDLERAALSAQVTRHEGWIEKAGPVVGVKYVPGSGA